MDSADEIDDEESDTYVDLDHYLPDGPQLDRIITTRSSRAQYLSSQKSIAVAEMNEGEAAELFRAYAKLRQTTSKETESEIFAIVQELGFLALAVTLAASYVSETPRLFSNIELFLPEHRRHRQRLLSQKARRNVHRYSDSVLSTWELSFAAIKRRLPEAAQLLTLLAFVNFNDIFPHLFVKQRFQETDESPNNPETLQWVHLVSSQNEDVDEYTMESWFAMLQAYSLIVWHDDQKAYAMHKLVNAWGHDRLEGSQRQKWSLAALELLARVSEISESDFDLSARLVPHIMANFTTITAACGLTYQTADRDRDSMEEVGELLHRLGRWDNEHDVRLYSLNAQLQALGSENPDTMMARLDMINVLNRQGKYEEAKVMQRQALELSKKSFGPEDSTTLVCMHNLASILHYQDKSDQAESMYSQMLELKKKVLGVEDRSTLVTMVNLVAVLTEQSKLDQAEALSLETVELAKKVLGVDDPSTLRSMNNLATVFEMQGKPEQAEALMSQALNLRKKVLGIKHPDTLQSMHNLASILVSGKKNGEAEALFQKAAELRKEVLGLEHFQTLQSMANLAMLQGKWDEVRELLSRLSFVKVPRVLGLSHG